MTTTSRAGRTGTTTTGTTAFNGPGAMAGPADKRVRQEKGASDRWCSLGGKV